MNESSSSIRIESVVFCDDVRKEITNKDLLIGVYSGDIVVASFPCLINAAVWIEIVGDSTGPFELKLRLTLTDKPPVPITIQGVMNQRGGTSTALNGLQFRIEKESELGLEIQDGENWRSLKRRKIFQGDVALPFPALKSGMPSNT
jgi:hypothetical protein